jgi:hypothetical protein
MTAEELNRRLSRRETFLVGSDGTFLGQLSTNSYAPESISNPYGRFGSKYSSTSIWNPYGTYGSKYSSKSPFNQYSTNPPRIFLFGKSVGYLTKNPYKINSLDPEKLEEWMKYYNL